MTQEKIRAIMIVEIAGRPPEHIKQALETHVNQLKDSKTIELISTNIHEPKEIEQRKDFYTCFAEVEIETENLHNLINLVFDYMPSSIEIIEPHNLNLTFDQATAFLNNLSGRLHRYDEVAKVAKLQTQKLAQQVQEMIKQGKIEVIHRTEDKLKGRLGKKKGGKKDKK